jgi:hypothetical protein
MNQILPYLPFWGSLKKLDAFFLLNQRIIWISKLHYVLYFSALSVLLFSSLALLIPVSIHAEVVNWSPVYAVLSILSSLGALFWAYHQTLYNIEKNQGLRPRFFAIKVLFINILCLSLFASVFIIPSVIYYGKTSSMVSKQSLHDEIEALSAVNFAFTCKPDPEWYSSGDNFWELDPNSESYEHDFETAYNQNKSYFNLWGYYGRYDEAKTAEQIEYKFKTEIKEKLTTENIALYLSIAKKYGVDIQVDPNEVLKAFADKKTLFNASVRKEKEKLLNIINSFYSAHKSYETFASVKFYLFTFFFIYYASTLIMLYKAMGIKEFIIAAVTGLIAIPIVVSFVEIFNLEKDILRVVFILACVGGLFLAAKGQKTFSRAILILASFAQVFLPFCILMLFDYLPGDTSIWLLFGALVFHGLTLVPVFHRFNLELRALPKD